MVLDVLEYLGDRLPLSVVGVMENQCPMSVQSTSSDLSGPALLARWGFLHPWVPEDPIIPGVGPDVPSVSVILCVLEHVGD